MNVATKSVQIPKTVADRIAEISPGEVMAFPAGDYWRVNSARQRVAGKFGRKFRIRRSGRRVYVVRLSDDLAA